MTEYRQTALVKNHTVRVILPKEFNCKRVNIVITPEESKNQYSFSETNFIPIELKKNESNYTTKILREERDLR